MEDYERRAQRTFIGTWIVRTLWKAGSLELQVDELEHFKWHMIGLVEFRRLKNGEVANKGHKLLFMTDCPFRWTRIECQRHTSLLAYDWS